MAENMTDIKSVEEKCKKLWEKEGVYRFNPKTKKKIYSIDTPPPTVSGRMHIGHAFSYSQSDFIARFMRMNGNEVFYPFGTDDNGLPTERLVEKSKGVKSKDMPREEFIKMCMNFLKEELPVFVQDWKNIGISCDWNLRYSTIDDESRKISQWSFLDLYKKKRVYRKDAPAMWCPECRTGVAQVEVQDKEINSFFNDIIFKIGKENVKVATTRPELLPACVAVFYHPEDERYKKYKGKNARVPLFNFEVPVKEDKRVDRKKGTGIVMCCTFGDQTDMEWQKAYNLPIKMAISANGKMTSIAGKYSDKNIKEARKEIIEDLKNAGLLTSSVPIKHFVNVHERCGTEIEFVKSKQWFVKYLDLKSDLLKWGKELNWHPEFMKHRYDNWVKGLQWDWLISNQRYFGVPFPIWYCKDCDEVILAKENQLPVEPTMDKLPVSKCPKCNSKNIIPETDVLNTWFTSSMSPQLATRSVKDESLKKKLFPMSLRPQAHEIISFWLFNTMVKSRLHFGKNPWKDVAISGFVTLKGEKMSKSKGNVISPQEVLEKYGADALRYWAASSKLGEDFDYQEKDLVTGKKLVTKLLNASRFIFMNLDGYKGEKPKKLEPLDDLFLKRLNSIVKSSTENFSSYEYSKAKSDIENFFWKDFCDNYLELIKKRIYKGEKDKKLSAQYTLHKSLLIILKLFAPIIPFITEEIYQEHYRKNEKINSIHLTEWPEFEKEKDSSDFDLLINNLSFIRQEKSKRHIPLNAPIKQFTTPDSKIILKNYKEDFESASGAESINQGNFHTQFAEDNA
ncbi:Isoleucine--tRNA ligase [uncultured archaeon]|nr:Isoleucine--tRNA ligase [uncultured archaeon]